MKCKKTSDHRLTGSNPFKASDYEKSMYRNYKCNLDFNLQGVSDETIFFLRQILSKKPLTRPSSEQVLEDEIMLSRHLDENNSRTHSLSRKIRKTPSL
jgi:serine/threonine protein kinase